MEENARRIEPEPKVETKQIKKVNVR